MDHMDHSVAVPCCLQDQFFERHGVKLGFMSAFVKAAADALREVPAVNGVIDGDEIIYRQAWRREQPGCMPALATLVMSPLKGVVQA